MDLFSSISGETPPCTYLKRQIQDSRGRKPSYVCTSTDGQYIAILYLPRSNKSIAKSLLHLDRSISMAMKTKLDSKNFMNSIKLDNDLKLCKDHKSHMKIITSDDKFDIYDEIEGFNKPLDYYSLTENIYPHFNEGRKEILDLKRAENIDFNTNYGACVVLYDTFFLNPISEIVLDDFFNHTNNNGENISKEIFHSFFIKFALGDSFILCFINDTLWIIHNNYLSHTYSLKLKLAPLSYDTTLQLDTVDLVSVLKNHTSSENQVINENQELLGKFIKSNNYKLYQCDHESYLYELIIHYETQFPIRSIFCHIHSPHNKCNECIHLKYIECFYPIIEFANISSLKCVASAMITDCRYVYYDENNTIMESDKLWVDSFTGLEFIENLITMNDGRAILPTPDSKQNNNVYKREFFCNILIATILSNKTTIRLVLSDINRKSFGTITIPYSNNPLTIKHSHNASYICCFSVHTLALIKLESKIDGNQDITYDMNVIYLVNPTENVAVWDFLDVTFGGDLQSKWLYISMRRGTNNNILCLYDIKRLDQQRITWAEECINPYIELNLNSTLFPISTQMVSIPCTNMLLFTPIHQRYISVLTPEYIENWENTATRNFMRFPLYSSNKEMLQLHFVWDDVKVEPISKQTTIPTLIQPTFCYHRGCTSIDSHISYLCSLNIELNKKYNQHSITNPGLYSIWPSIESLLALDNSTLTDIKSPPLRRVRYYGLDYENQFDLNKDISKLKLSNTISDSIYDMANSLIDEICELYTKGFICDNKWIESLLFSSMNHIILLGQMFENMSIDKNLFRFSSFDDYGERLSKLRHFWLTRMDDRGITLRRKCPASSRFKSLHHPTTLQILKEYRQIISESVIDKRAIARGDAFEKIKVAKGSPSDGNFNHGPEVKFPNGRSLSRDLLSIIPENKLPLSVLNNVSSQPRVDSLEALRRSTAEVALGICYLKMELDDKNVKLPKNLRNLLSFLTRATVAHHAYVNNSHHS